MRVRADASLLMGVAQDGDTAALRRLLDSGVPVDARDGRRRTALLAATHADRIDAARLLIERGADVSAKDEIQDSPFLYAGAEGRLEILRMTIAAGADLKAPIDMAAQQERRLPSRLRERAAALHERGPGRRRRLCD